MRVCHRRGQGQENRNDEGQPGKQKNEKSIIEARGKHNEDGESGKHTTAVHPTAGVYPSPLNPPSSPHICPSSDM